MASLREGRRLPSLPEGLGVALAFLLLDFLLSKLFPASAGRGWQPWALWTTAAIRAAEIVLLLLFWRLRGGRVADFGLDRARAKRGVRWGVLFSAALGLLVLFTETSARLVAGKSALGLLLPGALPASLFPPLFVAAVLVAPLAEELVFRGFLYGALRSRLAPAPALLLGVLLFALPHAFGGGGAPLIPAAGGLLFCLAYEFSGSLWAPVLIHALGNFALFGLRFLPGGWFA